MLSGPLNKDPRTGGRSTCRASSRRARVLSANRVLEPSGLISRRASLCLYHGRRGLWFRMSVMAADFSEWTDAELLQKTRLSFTRLSKNIGVEVVSRAETHTKGF